MRIKTGKDECERERGHKGIGKELQKVKTKQKGTRTFTTQREGEKKGRRKSKDKKGAFLCEYGQA